MFRHLNSTHLVQFLFAFYLMGNQKLVQCLCKAPTKLYKDLRCRPIFNTDFISVCPTKYDCSHLVTERRIHSRESKCYFDGVWYNINDYIQIPSVCGVGICKCTDSLNFECSKRECPFTILPNDDQCFLSYGFDQCCPESYHCISEWKNLSTCKVADTIYIQGELFPSPLDNCQLCICTEDFDTNYGPNVCRSVPCQMELFKSDELLKNCAPVYYAPTDCCPVDVKCPSATDIEAFERKSFQVDSNFCMFGPIKVPIGIRLTQTEERYGDTTINECICYIPPYMTCYRTFYS